MPTNEALVQISALVQELNEYEQKISGLEEEMKTFKSLVKWLEEEKIPEVFQRANLTSITLTDGSKVSIEEVVRASIPKYKEQEAFAWLRNNDYGDIIKNEVKASFGRGEDDDAQALMDYAKEHGIKANQKESVHSGTLKAFVKENLAVFDTETLTLLGAYIVNKAKVKRK